MSRRISRYFGLAVLVTAAIVASVAMTGCDFTNGPFAEATPTPMVGAVGNETEYAPLGKTSTDSKGITYVSNGNGTCTVTSIPYKAGTTKLVLDTYSPDGDQVTVLAPGILRDAKDLKEVVLPQGLYTICEYAFAGCTNLTKINIPNTVISIEQYAFAQCTSMENVEFGASLKVIGEAAFQDCNGLTEVVLSGNMETLGNLCFSYCENLTSITFTGLAQPNYTMILGCNKLHTLVINTTSPVLLDSFAYNTTIKRVVLGDNVPGVEESAFAGCHGIQEIVIGKNVEYLNNNCFYECDELVKVTFEGNSLVSLATGVFAYCPLLTEITLPEGCESIGAKCFIGDWELQRIHIPGSMTFVGESAFLQCEKLKEVTYSGSTKDWSNLSIRSGNDLLKAANVTCDVVPE